MEQKNSPKYKLVFIGYTHLSAAKGDENERETCGINQKISSLCVIDFDKLKASA